MKTRHSKSDGGGSSAGVLDVDSVAHFEKVVELARARAQRAKQNCKKARKVFKAAKKALKNAKKELKAARASAEENAKLRLKADAPKTRPALRPAKVHRREEAAPELGPDGI